MNPWPFVIAAYAITLLATLVLLVLSLTAMRRAETDVEAISHK